MTLRTYKELNRLDYRTLALHCGVSAATLHNHIKKGFPIGARLALRIQKKLKGAVTLQELTIDPLKKRKP